jgi:hypothetical protein
VHAPPLEATKSWLSGVAPGEARLNFQGRSQARPDRTSIVTNIETFSFLVSQATRPKGCIASPSPDWAHRYVTTAARSCDYTSPCWAQEIHHVVPGSSRCLEAIASIPPCAPARRQTPRLQARFFTSTGSSRSRLSSGLHSAHAVIPRLRARRNTRQLWRPSSCVALCG